jgi:hypothetical protein
VALQGTLDTFALADVLRLLAATTKTGRLRIDGDRGTGSVWLVDGGVTAGLVEREGPDGTVACTDPGEVVFELLRHREGTFEFHADEHTEDETGPTSVDEVVGAAEQKLADWREVEAVVPSLDHLVTLAERIDEEVVIGRDGWQTLLAIGEGRTVGQVGERLSMGEIAVSNAVKALVDERLAVIGDVVPPEATATEAETATDDEVVSLEGFDSPTTTIDDVVADLGASPELDEVVQAELAADEVVVDPSSFGGSHAVDLDSALETAAGGHAYLAPADPETPIDRPEPLPAELSAETETEAGDIDPGVLAQLSPRAAEALAAADRAEEEDGEQPMNRNLLMKFISNK